MTLKAVTNFVTDCKSILHGNQLLWIDIPTTFHHHLHVKFDFILRVDSMTESEKGVVSFPKLSIHPPNDPLGPKRKTCLIPVPKNTFDENLESILQDAIGNRDSKVIVMDNVSNYFHAMIQLSFLLKHKIITTNTFITAKDFKRTRHCISGYILTCVRMKWVITEVDVNEILKINCFILLGMRKNG